MPTKIEFDKYVVSGSIICDCGQYHIFLGIISSTAHACERCDRVYRLVPPCLTVKQEMREGWIPEDERPVFDIKQWEKTRFADLDREPDAEIMAALDRIACKHPFVVTLKRGSCWNDKRLSDAD